MAEAIAGALGGNTVDACSAGLTPLGWVADQTIATLEALGYPSDGLVSKGFDDIAREDFDVVVSLLGERGLDHIPLGFDARREAWAIPDPFGEDEATYLAVARQLERRIEDLLARESNAELLGP